MKILWAPWRYLYIRGNKEKECLFCRMIKEKEDSNNFIIYRGKHNFIVLNKYPYSPGHIMVVTYAHTIKFSELRNEAILELFQLIDFSIEILKEAFEPQGFNLGINVGKISGAGVEDHMHVHIVPRWIGDANFMTVIGETRVISEALEVTFTKLKDIIEKKKYKVDI